MVLTLISSAFALAASGMFFHLGWRTSKHWRRFRDEVFFHFMLIFFAVSLGCLAFIVLFTIIKPLPFNMSLTELFFLGIFYDLFYLELSFIYLTVFPNTKRIIDKYLPFLIAGAIIMNVIAGTARVDIYNLTGTVMHIIVIAIGMYLIYRTYKNLRINEKYFTRKEERNLIIFIEKGVLFAFITFLIDGIGFLVWHYLANNSMVITEFEILFFSTITVIVTTVGYWIINKAGKKAEDCDLLLILNTIS